MRFLRLLFILLVMAFGAGFAVMNAEPVRLDYYFGTRELALSVVLVGTLALGALLGVLASLGSVLRLRRENARLRRKALLAAEEVNNLRALPIQDR